MCGGWVEEQVNNTLSSAEKVAGDVAGGVADVGEGIVGGIEDAGKFIQEEVIDPVAEFGSSLEDAVRDAADDVNKVIENPYVQSIVSVINPAAGAVLSSYATLNSGDNLSPSQIAALAAAGYNVGTGVSLDPAVDKAIKAGTTIAEGGDVKDVLINTYGGDFAKELGLDREIKTQLNNFVGSDFGSKVAERIDINQAAADFAAGNSTERILANQFGDDVVTYLGAESPNQRAFGLAGIETFVQKSEGASDEDALLAGARRYRDEGGTVDLNQLSNLTGINVNFGDGDFFGKYASTFGNFDNLPDLGFIEDYVRQYGSQIDDALGFITDQLPNINLEGIDYDYLKNNYNLNLRDLKAKGIDVGNLAFNTDIDLGLPSIEVPEFDVPDVNLPDIPLPGIRPAEQGQPVEVAGLDIQDREALAQQAEEEEIPISELLLRDFELKNPLLKA